MLDDWPGVLCVGVCSAVRLVVLQICFGVSIGNVLCRVTIAETRVVGGAYGCWERREWWVSVSLHIQLIVFSRHIFGI